MKFAYFLLGVFFIIITVRTDARELKRTEKAVLLLKERTLKIKDFMEINIDQDALKFQDYLLFKAAKRGCLSLKKLEEKIEKGDEDFPDKTSRLLALYQLCSESTLTLTHFYTKQN